MVRLWNTPWRGGRAAPSQTQPAAVDGADVSANGRRDPCRATDIRDDAGNRTAHPTPSRLTPFPAAASGRREGQGPAESLASALFTSGTKYISSIPAFGMGGRSPGGDLETPVNIERRHSPHPVHKKHFLRIFELPIRNESFVGRARGSDGGASGAAVPITPLLGSFPRGTTPPITDDPRSVAHAEAEAAIEDAGNDFSQPGSKVRKEKATKWSVKALPGGVKAFLLHAWGGSVYDMFLEGTPAGLSCGDSWPSSYTPSAVFVFSERATLLSNCV